MQKSNERRRLLTVVAGLALVFVVYINSCVDVNALTKEQDQRMNELVYQQGYSGEVAADQIMEEFYNTDGYGGTGGIDGLLLNGSPAPNAQCGEGAEMNANPTPAPTLEPTPVPTPEPTAVPTPEPTQVPDESGDEPVAEPTAEPTVAPTAEPTAVPTVEPVKECKVHDWYSESVKEPTCTEKGLLVKTCKECGKVEEVETATIDHDYKLQGTVDGDCQHPATETFLCVNCGDTFTDDGPMGDHAYVKGEDSVEPSCGKEGVYNYTCAVCGGTYSETKEALVHEYSTTKQTLELPSCNTEGRSGYPCVNCGDVKDEEVILAKGHKYTDTVWVVKQAGIFTPGVGEIRCVDCKTVKETVEIPSTFPLWSLVAALVCALAATAVFVKVASGKAKRG